MADKAVFEIIISDKGVKITQKGVDNLGDSVQRTGKKARAAAGELEKVNEAVNSGVTGANNGTRGFARLRDSMQGSNGIVAAYATLATNAFAVGAAFNKLREARGVEMIMQGLSTTSERVGIELTTVSSAMKDVTGQAIDMADAMKYTAQLTAAGLNTSQIDKLTRAATTAAYALGRDVPDAIQRLTLAVAKNEPELVDELGMTIKSKEAWDEYGRAVGKSGDALTDQQKKIALLNAWTKQTSESFGDLSESMDPNEYNQLAATFTELTRSAVSGISQFLRLGEAAKYLAGNSFALTGVLTVFLSTISKQLIPGLYNLEAASAKERKAIEATIRVQRERIAVTNQLAQAQAKASMTSAVKDLSIDDKAPAKYKAYVEAEKAGNATATQRDSIIKTLTRSQAQYNRFVNGTVAVTAEEKAAAEALIATRQKQIVQIQQIQAIEAGAAAQTIAAENQIAGMRRKNVGSRLQGLALEKQAYAIQQAGTGSLKEALTGSLGALETYRRGLKNASEGAVRAGMGSAEGAAKIGLLRTAADGAKVGLFALNTGLKVLTSGLLRLIPYVGWAMLAWDLFGGTIKKILGGYFDTSKVEKAAEELSKVGENAGKVFERAARDQSNVATSAMQVVRNVQAEQKALEQAAGAVAKYREELRKAREAEENPNLANMTPRQRQIRELFLEQEKARKAGDRGKQESIGKTLAEMEVLDTLNEKYKLGLTDGSKALKYYSNDWNNLVDIQNSSLDFEQKRAAIEHSLNSEKATEIKLLNSLYKNPEAAKYFEEIVKGTKEYQALNHDQKIMAMEKALNMAADAHKNMAASVTELNRSMDQLNTTTTDFLISIEPSTPYNAMVKGLNSVTTGIMEARAAMVEGNYSDKAVGEFENSVVAVGQKNSQLLSAQTNEQLQSLSKLQAEYEKLGNNQELRAAKEAEILSLRGKIVTSVEKELNERESLFKAAQADAIVGQSLVGLAQARLQVLQRQGIVTASDYKKQIAAENNIKQMQINSLDIQKKLLSIKLDLAKQDLKKAKEELESAVRQEEEIERKQKLLALEKLQAAIKSSNLEEQKKAQEEINKLDDPNRHTADTIRRQATVKRLEDAMRAYGLGMQAINNQQKAIQITMQDSRTTELESQKYSIALQKRLSDLAQTGNDIKVETADIESEINSQLKSQINYYTKLQSIGSATAQKLSSTLANYAEQIASNQIELDKAILNRNASQIEAYTKIRDELYKNYRLEVERISKQDELNRLQLLGVDIIGSGIEMQQKALEPMQKALEIQQSLVDQRKQLRQLDAEITAKRLGTEVSPEQQRRLDILSAKESLNLSKQQLGLKIEGIKLEYALLEAQRLTTILELKSRRELLALELARTNRLDANSLMMLQQMDAALNSLNNQSYNAIRDNAIKQAQGEIAVKEKELELLQTRAAPIGEGILADMIRAVSVFQQIRKTDNEIKAIDTAETDAYITAAKAVIPDTGAMFTKAAKDLEAASEKYIPQQIKSLDALTAALTSEASRLRSSRLSAVAPSGVTSGNMVSSKPTDIKMTAGAWEKPVAEEMVSFVRFLQERIPNAIATSFNAGRHEVGSGHGRGLKADITGAVATSDIVKVAEEFKRLTGIIIKVNDEHTKPAGSKAWSGPHTDLKFMGRINPSYQTPGIGDGLKPVVSDTLTQAANSQQNAADSTEAAASKLMEAADKVILVLGQETSQAPRIDAKGLSESVISAFGGSVGRANKDGTGAITSLGGTELKQSVSDKVTAIDSQLTSAVSTLREKLKTELFPDGTVLTGPEFDAAMETFKKRFAEGFAAAKATAQEQLKTALPMTELSNQVSEFWEKGSSLFDPMIEGLKKLGPDGEFAAAAFSGIKTISIAITDFAKDVEQGGLSLSNVATLASTALNVIQSVTQAASNAKIAGIDKEIAAEQKRDGKSKESLAKLDAMEKKKDQIARKQFNINKKISMAQAVIATATGIAEALKMGPIAGPILAGMIGAMGLAQIAIISGTQYESSYTPKAPEMPSTLSIGKRDSSVNLASGPNANAGGEVGYMRGASGYGTNAGNYNTLGSAYGGNLTRGYGNRGFIVGEKGPELITPETPINVTPANENTAGTPVNATFNIQAIDSQGVQDVLVAQKGNIIQMLRQAANASGQRFLEDVNVNVYTRPSVGKLL